MISQRPLSKPVEFGDYLLTGRLGEGGMCHVFRARHKDHDEDCALKMLKENQRKDERLLELFVTEADLALLLEHPKLMQRPIVIRGEQARVARPSEKLLELFD